MCNPKRREQSKRRRRTLSGRRVSYEGATNDGELLVVRGLPVSLLDRFDKLCASRGWTRKRAIVWFLLTVHEDDEMQKDISEPLKVPE